MLIFHNIILISTTFVKKLATYVAVLRRVQIINILYCENNTLPFKVSFLTPLFIVLPSVAVFW